jgi:hypothetical protein
MTSLKVPSSKGVSAGPIITAFLHRPEGPGYQLLFASSVQKERDLESVCLGERETYHVMTLSAMGEAETPAGGSVCMR